MTDGEPVEEATAIGSSATTWDPSRYLRFADLRHRPALDLVARIDCADPEVVHDVGCGTGALARTMADRWPHARVFGSDNSAAMLEEAAASPSAVTWQRRDVADWDSTEPVDVITANAVLHWVPDHDDLILRLLGSVRRGGALAIQMPLSWHEPSHVLMRQTLRAEALGSMELHRRLERQPVADPAHYYRLLAGGSGRLDVWTTRYLHPLAGTDPVLEWMSGTGLRPVLDELASDEQARFLERYRTALWESYPADDDGVTLFPFPRLFVVAHT